MKNPFSLLLVLLVKIYQIFLSPLKPPTCRYYPTCSQYFLDAVRIRGPIRGTWMGIRRILRCHPFHEGGFDPVLPPSDREEPADAEPPTEEPGSERATSSTSAVGLPSDRNESDRLETGPPTTTRPT